MSSQFCWLSPGGNQSRGEEVGDTNARMQAKMDPVTNRPTRLRGR